ncbi:MAG: hypothetical protein LBB28_03090 [Synergistaceae bacterium]|nr:hypothetical protein [Synergistaceae bacterium]
MKIHSGGGNARFFIARIAFALLFLASIAFLITRGGYLFFDRIGSVRLNSPALAVAAGENPSPVMYVVDSSRKRLIFVGASGRADYIINAGKGAFSEIYDLTTDASGDIFILDTERDGETCRIKSDYYRVSGQNGLVAVSESAIIMFDEDKPRIVEGFEANGGILALRVCAWLAALICLTGGVWCATRLARLSGAMRFRGKE